MCLTTQTQLCRPPEWASFLSMVDGSLNPVPLRDLDHVLLKEVLISKVDLLSTYLPHLQGVSPPMTIWNLQL